MASDTKIEQPKKQGTQVLVDERVLSQVRRQQVLSSIEIAINQTHELAPLLRQVVVAVEKYLPATGGSSILLWDETSQSFKNSASSRLNQKDEDISKKVRRESGATRWIVDHCETLVVPDVSKDPFTANKMLGEAGLLAYIGIPLVSEQKCIGVLYALSKEKREYTQADKHFLEALSIRVAAAVKNVALLNEVKNANDALMAEKFALKQSQRQLAESLHELETLSQEKSRFFAGISHEIRTPLNAIIGFAELLREDIYGELNEKQFRAVDDIYNSGAHLLDLVNDLLDLSKLDAGKLKLELSQVDIQALFQDSLNYVRNSAMQKNIALSITQATMSNSEPQLIQADKQKLRQIVLNLLSNAVKYTPEGGSIILGLQDTKDEHHIFVKDTGVGISQEDQSKLFQEFSQLDDESNHHYKGTGLGLVLSQQLAGLHHGVISLESVEGKGSTFTFKLPKTLTV